MSLTVLLLVAFAPVAATAAALLMRHDRNRWRNAAELATKRASDLSARCTLLQADVVMLDHALARRDASLDAAYAQNRAARPRLDALETLERLVRQGYGPSFTQGAARTCQRVEVFGPASDDFVRAVARLAKEEA